MGYLQLGLAMFAVPHLFSMLLPDARSTLRSRMGEGPFKGLYSLVALAGVAFIVWGYRIVSNDPAAAVAYQPWAAARHLTMLLVLVAFILIGASHGKGYIKRWVRQPLSWGILLWAAGHLLVNGKAYDVWLFGTFLAIAVLDIALSEARSKVPRHEPRLRSDIIAVAVGLVLYAIVIVWFHPSVIGLPILT